MSLGESGRSSNPDLGDLAVQMYFQTDVARKIAVASAGQKSAKASRPLLWMAIFHTFVVLFAVGIFQQPLAEGIAGAWILFSILSAVAAAFWGLWAWSLVNPLPAAIVGLLLYCSIAYAIVASRPEGPASQMEAFLFRAGLVGIVLLIKAILNGARQRRLVLPNPLGANGLPVKQKRSIASAIWLYIVLLSIVVIPFGLQAKHDFLFRDHMDVLKLMAIVVVTWAALCWRDTFPAIRNVASPGWFLLALLMGTMTAVFASLYGDVLASLTAVSRPSPAQGYLDAGCGWLAIIGIVAAYPAVFEELAFRGIIVPGLQRILSDKETIAVSGMMFMILHLNVVSAPALLAGGIILGYMRIRSGSLWPGVLMHFTHNALILAFGHWHF
jgi:membrane protease YdiL (CAAX protease family)